MPTAHPRIALTKDPALADALDRARRVLGPLTDAALTRALVQRAVEALPEDDRDIRRQRRIEELTVRAPTTDHRVWLEELRERFASEPIDHERTLSKALEEVREERLP